MNRPRFQFCPIGGAIDLWGRLRHSRALVLTLFLLFPCLDLGDVALNCVTGPSCNLEAPRPILLHVWLGIATRVQGGHGEKSILAHHVTIGLF